MNPLIAMSAALLFLSPAVMILSAREVAPLKIQSPDKHLEVGFFLDTNGAPRYEVRLDGKALLLPSRLGLVRDDADFSTGLRLVSTSRTRRVKDHYEILTGKRRLNTYRTRRKVFHLQTSGGAKMDIIFQVSNDGIAFRYYFPGQSARIFRLKEEVSSFHFLPGTRAWIQPMSAAKSGWKEVNPCYEEPYLRDVPAGTLSPTGAGWVYPALFCSSNLWLLVSEGALPRNYCGTRLRSDAPGGEYSVGFPDSRENLGGGPVDPQSTLPWLTPWRILALGSLKAIAESTLGTDLAPGAAKLPANAIQPVPGKASWSWALLGDRATRYDVQKRFVDYAASMKWRYCLVDAGWDRTIGYDRMADLVRYARDKGVSILLWYNSAGDWNQAPPTPRDRMLTHQSRIREFSRLKEMGIAGLKIDFFGGDGQSMIDYYIDILEDAAPFGLLLNFHGATLPRGWQRTYPYLMTTEAIRGMEHVDSDPEAAADEAAEATVIPFTRNVFDPMDFTPMVLDRFTGRVQRQTTSGFELATSVIFTSGIQHYAEIPEGMAKAPGYVRDFLRELPSIWDDTKFLDGYPGQFVAFARRGNGRWYLAGINAEPTSLTLHLDLRELTNARQGTLIMDGDGGNLSFERKVLRMGSDHKLEITLKPRGGFVAVF